MIMIVIIILITALADEADNVCASSQPVNTSVGSYQKVTFGSV